MPSQNYVMTQIRRRRVTAEFSYSEDGTGVVDRCPFTKSVGHGMNAYHVTQQGAEQKVGVSGTIGPRALRLQALSAEGPDELAAWRRPLAARWRCAVWGSVTLVRALLKSS